MVAKIEIISKELIKPSSPTPPNKIPTFETVFIKSTRCILPFSWKDQWKPFPDCDDSGALYVDAQVHSRLTQEAISREELDQFLPVEPYNTHQLFEHNATGNSIPLAIKFNSFECGGTSIGVCISHKIADAMSLMTFTNTSAAKCRESPFPGFTQSAKNEKVVTKRFAFDKEKLAALKVEASSAASGSQVIKDPTRVEVVSALLWKHFIVISRAKVNGSSAKNMFAAAHAVNLRRRVRLPLESFAFGNFETIASALLMSKEKDQEYYNLAWHLMTAIKKINDDYVNNVQSGLPYLCNLSKEFELMSMQEVSYCFITSWRRFPT
ncbi:hypothetical protein ACH5RR_009014 [Cinchona calisaya]|uniref:Transferase n=1 Tax=Cinchona calisaya TaxID=153742 RepID=A0ABD3AD86_9GENT